MDSFRLYTLSETLANARGLLIKIAANSDDINTLGFRILVNSSYSEDEMGSLRNLERDYFKSKPLADIINPTLSRRLAEVVENGNVLSLISQIRIHFEIEVEKKNSFRRRMPQTALTNFSRLFSKFLLKYPSSGGLRVNDVNVDLFNLISEIDRAHVIVNEIWEESHDREANDQLRVFEPSRININTIDQYIETAVSILNNDEIINIDVQKFTILQLTEARAELQSNSPAWQKIVGSLVICATILSGIAAAPEALRNIRQAQDYLTNIAILSISKEPTPLALPKPQLALEENPKDDKDPPLK
ncbi:hypothetical protein [Pararhodobacter sp.]|uniref:hypothetical protein n=1 Tax=Pararhodobacter sp. TaxID=2127056 RepID=UPI002FDDA6F3